MKKIDRVLAAVRGEEVDRVPFSLWLHNFTRENTARDLADETIRLYRTFDWDLVKPQSRPYCYSQMWGLRYVPSTSVAMWPTVEHYPVRTAGEFAALEPVPVAPCSALSEQIEAFGMVRDALGPDVPIIATIFAPIMVAAFMLPDGMADVVRFMSEAPDEFEKGLAAISDTLAEYAVRCRDAGTDGIFYATTVANAHLMTEHQFARFQTPFDLAILNAAPGPLDILHMCGDNILFDSFADYPAPILSWAANGMNPSLKEAHARTGKAVMGGLPGKPAMGAMAVGDVLQRARESLREMDGRFHILGPDCSINPDTPAETLAAITQLMIGPKPADAG